MALLAVKLFIYSTNLCLKSPQVNSNSSGHKATSIFSLKCTLASTLQRAKSLNLSNFTFIEKWLKSHGEPEKRSACLQTRASFFAYHKTNAYQICVGSPDVYQFIISVMQAECLLQTGLKANWLCSLI